MLPGFLSFHVKKPLLPEQVEAAFLPKTKTRPVWRLDSYTPVLDDQSGDRPD